jgi:hypothetical protein
VGQRVAQEVKGAVVLAQPQVQQPDGGEHLRVQGLGFRF